jgi:hypothetical protein
MNPRELVDLIRSGPAALQLYKPLRFRRRTRSNPIDFNEFLQVLQSSETIRTVHCWSQLRLGISDDEWVLLIKTLGRIKDIQTLRFDCVSGSRDFHPFQAIAEAVMNAHSLCKLTVYHEGIGVPGDPSGVTALANALRQHTNLQEIRWIDFLSRTEEVTRDLSLDLVIQALPACPYLRKVTIWTLYGSVDAIKTLLQLRPATELVLVLNKKENWLMVADEIRRGHCNVKRLTLIMHKVHAARSSEATEAVKAVASAIQMDFNLESLVLRMVNGITDEACLALAEALTINKTLRKITLFLSSEVTNFGAHVYKAFSAMLRVNTSLVLEPPPFEYDGADERLIEAWHQMEIELRLNQAGRGRLLSSTQTTREEYVDALHELNTYNAEASPAFQVSCLYSLLRLKPSVTCMS